jgi:predicted dehydrogenase
MAGLRQIRLGVIGLGDIARNCLDAVHNHESDFELTGLCSLDAVALERASRHYGVSYTITSYNDLIAHPDIEAVAIYSPDPLHFPMIETALRAGKDVVVTKPMVTSSADARRVIDLMEETGRRLMVGETSRYALNCLGARRLVDDGDLGRLVFGETHYVHDMRPVFDRTPWRYLEPKDFPIGSMCHPVSLLTWYLGEVDEVFAYGVNSGVDPRYPAEVPDTYLVNLRFRNGALGRILGAFGIVEPPLPMESLSLFGTEGSFVQDRLVLDRLPGKPVSRIEFAAETGHEGEVRRYLAEFAGEIRDGTASSSSAGDALSTVLIGEAIKQSVASGTPVSVATP